MIEVTAQGQVIYKTGDNRLGRFPEAASQDLLAGPKRNFQVFDPLDFLAEVTQHIPDPGEHLIRYYGFYSNKSRGLGTQGQAQAAPAAAPNSASTPSAKQARKRWAALIKQVYEVDPLNSAPDHSSPGRLPALGSLGGRPRREALIRRWIRGGFFLVSTLNNG